MQAFGLLWFTPHRPVPRASLFIWNNLAGWFERWETGAGISIWSPGIEKKKHIYMGKKRKKKERDRKRNGHTLLWRSYIEVHSFLSLGWSLLDQIRELYTTEWPHTHTGQRRKQHDLLRSRVVRRTFSCLGPPPYVSCRSLIRHKTDSKWDGHRAGRMER